MDWSSEEEEDQIQGNLGNFVFCVGFLFTKDMIFMSPTLNSTFPSFFSYFQECFPWSQSDKQVRCLFREEKEMVSSSAGVQNLFSDLAKIRWLIDLLFIAKQSLLFISPTKTSSALKKLESYHNPS